MKLLRVPSSLSLFPLQYARLAAVLASGLALIACGGGGGGGPAPVLAPPEAVVTTVQTDVSVLEGTPITGSSETSDLVFDVSFDKPVISRLELRVSTFSGSKTGVPSTPGAATGGANCELPGVDFIELKDQPLVFAAKAISGQITVKVCRDAVFEPNEVLFVNWKPVGGTDSTVKGVILNDDAGGLNSTGATSLLGGLSAFGRDVNALTNSNTDGALGFSFDSTSSSPCVLDKVTGLLWQKEAVLFPFANTSTLVDRANNANLCGRTTWRMPRSNELLSLLNFSASTAQPMNADAPFSAEMNGSYWSDEQVLGMTGNAWVVSPGLGGGGVTYFSKTATHGVRLVSDGNLIAPPLCEDAGTRFYLGNEPTVSVPDGTAYDRKTGLMWKRCTEGDGSALCRPTFDTSGNATYTSNWLRNVNANPATLGAGFSDWRIPTVKEMASLVDRCNAQPAINTTIFPDSYSASYLTSTVDANNVTQFWYVNFFDGTVAVGPSVQSKRLRLVRAGQ